MRDADPMERQAALTQQQHRFRTPAQKHGRRRHAMLAWMDNGSLQRYIALLCAFVLIYGGWAI
jgi:hypothetical protein